MFDCAYDTDGTAAKYVYELERIIEALREADEEIKAHEKTFNLLNGVPQSWREWRDLQETIIQHDKPDDIIAAIKARESTLNGDRIGDGNGETVLAVEGRNNGYQGGRRKFDGRSLNGESGGNAQGSGMSVTSYYCHKQGHRKSECRKFKYNQRRVVVADKTSTAAQAVQGDVPNTSLFTAFSTPRFPSDSSHWLLDSGCSNHVIGLRKCFTTYMPSPQGNHTIRVANNSDINALGRGDVTLNVWDAGEQCGKRLIRHDVLHVPEYGRNSLLSISQL